MEMYDKLIKFVSFSYSFKLLYDVAQSLPPGGLGRDYPFVILLKICIKDLLLGCFLASTWKLEGMHLQKFNFGGFVHMEMS